MPPKSTNIPKPKAESDWYTTPQGRRQTQRECARALRTGTLVRSAGLKVAKTNRAVLEQLMQQAKDQATRAISIRIPITDLERAKRVAADTGVGYQTVLKQAIRDGLKRTG